MATAEVVIVGGGVNGSAIAYHLARAGVSVTVFDLAEPAVEPSASWASAGGVRQQGRDPREWPLTLEASRRWAGLAAELGSDIGFAQGGHLHLVERAADLPALEARVAREQAAGMPIQIITGAELREVAPTITTTAIAGAYTPSDGQANPTATTLAFAAAARRHGATYRVATRVDSLAVESGRVVGLVTAAGERFAADWTIVAAGAWTNRLLARHGLGLPIRPRAPQMLLTDAATPRLKPTVTGVGRQLSLKQLPTGEYFIGGGWPSDVFERDGGLSCRVRDTSIAGSWAVATDVVPDVARQRVARAWCGLEAQSFDGVPLIGPAPGLAGLYLAVGFSGHGFQIAPAVGRTVADAIQGRPTPELAELDPARAAAFDAEAVAAFKAEATGEMEVGTLG